MQIDNNKALADGLELFKQSKWHKKYNVEDIYRYLIAPIKHNRIRLYYQEDKPVGLVTWCWLDKQAGKDFLQGQYYITEDDYVEDSKEELWGIEFITPYGDARQVMSLILKYHKDLYQRQEKINWRRLHEPAKRHTREFKT
jgi:hemolysin-activating ACP:hemolysin acyltransferase|tara:strand:- start:1020 stop:1442 length:423 start_codon:yes stop_codon:yes gene_type:complete